MFMYINSYYKNQYNSYYMKNKFGKVTISLGIFYKINRNNEVIQTNKSYL